MEAKGEHSLIHKLFPEGLPHTTGLCQTGDKTDKAHRACLEESGQKQASRQKESILTLPRK